MKKKKNENSLKKKNFVLFYFFRPFVQKEAKLNIFIFLKNLKLMVWQK